MKPLFPVLLSSSHWRATVRRHVFHPLVVNKHARHINLLPVDESLLISSGCRQYPLSEQRVVVNALAQRLCQIDKLVESTEATVARLTEYRTALITAATTGKIDVRNSQATEKTA